MNADGFDGALDGLDESWRGLSLTMPLKESAWRRADVRDRRAQLTGAVNTLCFSDDGLRGFNTDVGGIVRALEDCGLAVPRSVRVLGAGATAASALVALEESGAERIELVVRTPSRAAGLHELAKQLGVELVVHELGKPAELPTTTLTISTLPGGITLPSETLAALAAEGGSLFDVAYDPWPSALAHAWEKAGHAALSGRWMLLHQAVLQVRAFVTGQVEAPLPREDEVVASMRSVLMGD